MSDYRAPVCENDDDRVETPVGVECMECDEKIVEGDSGVVVNVMVLGDGFALGAYAAPMHKECMLRAAVGPLAHLDKKCSCFGGTGYPDSGMTMRQESLAVYRRVHACLS